MKLIALLSILMVISSCILDSDSEAKEHFEIEGKWTRCYKNEYSFYKIEFNFTGEFFYFLVNEYNDITCKSLKGEYYGPEGGKYILGSKITSIDNKVVKRLTLNWYRDAVKFGPDLVYYINGNKLVFGEYNEGESPELDYEYAYYSDI